MIYSSTAQRRIEFNINLYDQHNNVSDKTRTHRKHAPRPADNGRRRHTLATGCPLSSSQALALLKSTERPRSPVAIDSEPTATIGRNRPFSTGDHYPVCWSTRMHMGCQGPASTHSGKPWPHNECVRHGLYPDQINVGP
jgi:hypothetical protein